MPTGSPCWHLECGLNASSFFLKASLSNWEADGSQCQLCLLQSTEKLKKKKRQLGSFKCYRDFFGVREKASKAKGICVLSGGAFQ